MKTLKNVDWSVATLINNTDKSFENILVTVKNLFKKLASLKRLGI